MVPALRHVRNTPEWSFTLPNHNWLIKFFVRLTGGRTFTVPTVGSHDSNEGTILTTLPSFDPEQHEGQCTQHDTESLFPREGSPSKLGGRKEFDVNIKNAAWELASEFSSTSSLLLGMYKAQVPKDKIALLVIEALSLRAKSTATMEGIVKHVSGLVLFYLDTREESKVQLAGGDSLVLIHDYLESLAERGRTVHAAAKHALTVWAEALGIDWPLTHTLVCSSAAVESNESPKQAPAMSLSTLRSMGETSTNILVTPYKRAFDAGILLMTYASLRFSDVQRIRTFGLNEDSVRGALLNCKTRKQRVQFRPWACPREGITGSREWAQPLIDMRLAFRRINGNGRSFTFMWLDRARQLVAADASPYSTARRKLAILFVALGDPEGERYTLHSPKNLLPTAASQLSFDQREMNIIGHWSSASKMPERYDRSAGANELLLRNTIVQRMRGGWTVAPAFHLPLTISDATRIGRSAPTVEIVDETKVDETKVEETLAPVSTEPLGGDVNSQASEDGAMEPTHVLQGDE